MPIYFSEILVQSTITTTPANENGINTTKIQTTSALGNIKSENTTAMTITTSSLKITTTIAEVTGNISEYISDWCSVYRYRYNIFTSITELYDVLNLTCFDSGNNIQKKNLY